MNYLRITSGLWVPEPVYNLPGMIPGPGFMPHGGRIVSRTYVTGAVDAGGSTPIDFGTLSFGASEDADKLVVVVVGADTGTDGVSISGVSIGGAGGTEVIKVTDNDSSMCGIFAKVTSSTSGNVTLTLSADSSRAMCQVYEILGGASLIVDAANKTSVAPTGDPADLTIDVPANSVIIAATGYATVTNVWENVTLDNLQTVENTVLDVASAYSAILQSSLAIAANFSSDPGRSSAVAAAFSQA